MVRSSSLGSKVCAVSPDGKTVRTLLEMETPADVGIDWERDILHISQLRFSKARLYRLERK